MTALATSGMGTPRGNLTTRGLGGVSGEPPVIPEVVVEEGTGGGQRAPRKPPRRVSRRRTFDVQSPTGMPARIELAPGYEANLVPRLPSVLEELDARATPEVTAGIQRELGVPEPEAREALRARIEKERDARARYVAGIIDDEALLVILIGANLD